MIYWQGEPFIERKMIALPGKHNLENILAAVAACILYGCEKDKMEEVLTNIFWCSPSNPICTGMER